MTQAARVSPTVRAEIVRTRPVSDYAEETPATRKKSPLASLAGEQTKKNRKKAEGAD